MSWRPLGKFVLVRLHTTGSVLDLSNSDIRYNGLGEVIGVGADVEGVSVGDTVLLNGPQGIIAHEQLGEHIGLVAAPLVLARRVEEVAN